MNDLILYDINSCKSSQEGQKDHENTFLIGVDEAGRGSCAGPLSVGAVKISLQQLLKLGASDIGIKINDSKKLSKNDRSLAYKYIQDNFVYSQYNISVEDVEKLNPLGASLLGMEMCINEMLLDSWRSNNYVIVDGNALPQNYRQDDRVRFLIKGDSISFVVACASIVAKVSRDLLMDELHKDFPMYGWNSNKGYGSKLHKEAVAQFGRSAHHRKNFNI